MKKRIQHYTIIELLVATGVFLLMMVLTLRFYSSSQGFVQRSTEMSRHVSIQSIALRYIKTDLKYLNDSRFYDVSDPANPTISILPITEVSAGTHYRFYANTIDENNQQTGDLVAVSLRLDSEGRLLRSAMKIPGNTLSALTTHDLTEVPLSASAWTEIESDYTALLASEIEDFELAFYSEVNWTNSKVTPVDAVFNSNVLTSFPKAIGISVSTAKRISSTNQAAKDAASDRTKQTISTIIYP